MGQPLILIVEDDESTQRLYAGWLRKHAQLLQAYDSATARRFTEERFNDIHGVIMDGLINRQTRETTVSLVKLLRDKDFKGPLVARTSEIELEYDMMDAGCTHAVPKAGHPASELKELFTILGFDIKEIGLDKREDF